MDNMWIIFVFIYSLLKGSRDGMKKAAMQKNNSDEILFFYSLIGFILIIPFSPNAFHTPPIFVFYTFLKALVVGVAWIMAYGALKNMTVSLFGIMDMARMVFSMLFAIAVLGESFTWEKAVGAVLVTSGLVLVNTKKDSPNGRLKPTVILLALGSCLFNSVSGTLDKVLMKDMEADQLQFWFMFFLIVIYGAILIFKKEKISLSSVKRNYWIPIMSASLILGDRLLFIANSSPESQVSLMTLIKQSSVLVTVVSGWLFFKDKNTLFKLACSFIILLGIYISIV